jgi:hypothetical protein
MPLVLDTGPIYASIDRSDPDHGAVVELLRSTPRPHIVVEPVLVEVDYWLHKLLDVTALDAFVSDVIAGRYELVSIDDQDLGRIVELEARYEDADLGFVDAALVAVCERLDIGSVATFDRRHFGMIRPRHRRHLDLLP